MSPREILQQLIAIPSVNPMRRDVTGDIYGEKRMSDWLVAFFLSLGAPYERIEVLAGRDNVIAKYDAGHPTTTILLDAHQDTVPVEGMTVAPFEAKLEAGRIFGRGAADVTWETETLVAANVAGPRTHLRRSRVGHARYLDEAWAG